MEENTSRLKLVIKYLFENVIKIFGLAMIGASFSGWLIFNFAPDTASTVGDGFFDFISGAVSFDSIMQFFALSICLAVLLLVFLSDIFLARFMLLKRYCCFLVSALILLSAFILIFGWFPEGMWLGWVALLGLFTIFSSTSMLVEIKRVRREEKEYNEALAKLIQK